MNHDHSEPSPPRVAAFLRGPFVSLWLPVVTIVAATLAWAALPANSLAEFVAEGGPVENATAVLYGFAVAAVVVAAWPGSGWKTPAALVIGSAGLVARELDLHRTAANDSVLRVSFYYGHAPLQTKLVALAVIGLFLLAAGYLTVRHAGPLLRALKHARPVAVTVLVFFLTGIAAKAFDRGVGMLVEDFRVVLSTPVAVWAQTIEETLEACLPMLIMLGAYQVQSGRTSGPSP
ncbi:MAG: hypothetical protein Q8R33_05850 [Burkholderiales bacterium]|nr:hypothetical protein [Burkholderiales bacterium]